jgi:hypothetical protein
MPVRALWAREQQSGGAGPGGLGVMNAIHLHPILGAMAEEECGGQLLGAAASCCEGTATSQAV